MSTRCSISKQTKQHAFKAYMKIMKDHNGSNKMSETQVRESVAQIFSISESEVRKILREGYHNVQSTSKGRGKNPKRHWNEVLKKELQIQIWNWQKEKRHFTMKDLCKYAQEELEYEGSESTLLKIIKSMGYKYKIVNNRKILCEQKRLLQTIIKFLRTYLQYCDLKDDVTFVYLDETWIYQNGTAIRQWTNEDEDPGQTLKKKESGKRFTVLHAGSKFGFLEGCDLLLHTKNNDMDYHKTMDGKLFENWTKNQLLPALTKIGGKCVVVMDNAPYHSMLLDKPPTFSSKKGEMQAWLMGHDIQFDNKMTKKQLFDLIKLSGLTDKKYVIDDILHRHGHDVLRLPPYHCQYNPIELAWGQCKTYYNKHIDAKNDKDKVTKLWKEALQTCTGLIWQSNIRHCEDIIRQDWTRLMGNFSIQDIPPIIINLMEDSDESDDNETDDDDE